MKQYFKSIITFFLLIILLNNLNGQNTIPINPSTGLVSINNVIQLPGKSIEKLKETAKAFIARYSYSTLVLQNEKRDTFPIFKSAVKLNEESLLVYSCFIATAKGFKNDEITDIIEFQINFYFKEEKMKYDITNFTHQHFGLDSKNDFTGGKFENENPQKKGMYSNKKWMHVKLETIEKAKNIANAVENFFTKESKNQTDF